MADRESAHARLQQQIDCQLEITPKDALAAWEQGGWSEEPGTDGDEAPLKYMALVLLDAIEEKAARLSIDKDAGVTVFADKTYTLPKAPTPCIARGLEILRDITGLEGPAGTGKLALGVRSDGLDLMVEKEAGAHVVKFPPWR